MKKITETTERFEDALNNFRIRLNKSQLTYEDGFVLFNLADNLLLRYEQVRKSRENWRTKYYKLKNEKNNWNHRKIWRCFKQFSYKKEEVKEWIIY